MIGVEQGRDEVRERLENGVGKGFSLIFSSFACFSTSLWFSTEASVAFLSNYEEKRGKAMAERREKEINSLNFHVFCAFSQLKPVFLTPFSTSSTPSNHRTTTSRDIFTTPLCDITTTSAFGES